MPGKRFAERLAETLGLLDAWAVGPEFAPHKVPQLMKKLWVQTQATMLELPTAELIWVWLASRQAEGRIPVRSLADVRRFERGSNMQCRAEIPWWKEVALARLEVWKAQEETSARLEEALNRQAQARLLRSLRSRATTLEAQTGVVPVTTVARRDLWMSVKTSYVTGGIAKMDQHLLEMEQRGEVLRMRQMDKPHRVTCRS